MKRKKNTREPLTLCAELRADDKFRKVAVQKLDSRILALVSRDLVAAEGHYHRSCYRLYTKGEDNTAAEDVGGTSDIDTQYEAAEKQSFSSLTSGKNCLSTLTLYQ